MIKLLVFFLIFQIAEAFVAPLKNEGVIRNSKGIDHSKRDNTLWTSLAAKTSKSAAESTKKRVNTVVREVMALIESRYSATGEDWQRTRMYVYRAKNLSLTQVEQVLSFLDSFLSQESTAALLKDSPRILNKSVQSYLKPTATFLEELWGADLFEQAMQRNPQLLLSSGLGYNVKDDDSSLTAKETEKTVENLLRDMAGISVASMGKLRKSNPFVFGLDSKKVQEVLEHLTLTLEPITKDEIKPTILRKLILGNPSILNLSVETNLRHRVDFLSSTLKLTPAELAKIVQTGGILTLSVNKNLKPTLQYLCDDLLLGDGYLKKCILSHPQLLALSLKNLQEKATFFKSIGPTLAPRIARRCPAVLSLSLESNIIPTIEFLAKIWGCEPYGLDMESSLTEYPNILSLSLQGNLQPTMNFFNRTGYTALDDDWKLVDSSSTRIRGRYIASSLYQRLLPRWHYCVNHELQPPALHVIVIANDSAFCQHQSTDLENFLRFRKEAIPRLKFSSQFDTWLKTGRPIDI